MSLWYNPGKGWKPFVINRRNLNADVYFCCPGPSLKEIDPTKLNGPGRLVSAVNNAYPFVRPDIWFGMDDPNCYSRQIFWEPFIKVLRGGYGNRTCEGHQICHNYNVCYADVVKKENALDIFACSEGVHFIWKKNVMATALHVLFWMGAKNIYFIGCDLDNSKADYHHGQVLSEKNKKWNGQLYKDILPWITRLSEEAKIRGINFYSCSKKSKLNSESIPYVDIDEAIAKSESNIPFGGELTHTLDIIKEE